MDAAYNLARWLVRDDHDVFMWPMAGDTTSAERIEAEHGYNVDQLTVAGMNCWVVSDLNQQELDRFARLIRAKG